MLVILAKHIGLYFAKMSKTHKTHKSYIYINIYISQKKIHICTLLNLEKHKNTDAYRDLFFCVLQNTAKYIKMNISKILSYPIFLNHYNHHLN